MCGLCNGLTIYQNDSQLILTSDQIVYGKIVNIQSAWNAQKTHIVTTAEIFVNESFIKDGTMSINAGTTIPVSVLGGTSGNTTEWVEDMPAFVPDSDAFVYLKKSDNGEFAVNGLDKGIHIVFSDSTALIKNQRSSSAANDKQLFRDQITSTLQGVPADPHPSGLSQPLSAQTGASGPTISSVSPTSASAGTDTVITISGSGFGTKASRQSIADVRFLYRTDGTYPYIYATGYPYLTNANDIVSWTDTEIKVRVPTGMTYDGYGGGSASSGFLDVLTDSAVLSNAFPFTVTFGYGKTKWNTPVTFYVNEGTVSGSGAAIQNAASSWNHEIPDASFGLNYGGPSTCTTFGKDGRSLLFFGPASDFSSYPTVIAWNSRWSSGGIISETDIEFNSNWTWTTGYASGSTMNVETIVLHEQGHSLCLNDLYGFLPEYGYPGYLSDISPDKESDVWL